ncbi:putative activating enzyme (E1 family) of ubiquitin-like proteins; NAD/FAD-binding protein [Cupriavidus taiwanensis]|uniref:tRNA cyclic N6-threonylcarbamoyladenosine(37) synthase TcdA n=1 Tax=Cupriavidus taiwanensis TaxID=164546 RepID=UPI000E13E183|nr:tRNA cyclic N6-threonylcarbamoyladenosine(37) synthase TcdA [Cupriavidus taiwanensis]SOZ13808.1 putative activating enzyme (E1 family) of ubiquitin-like proteins; NAD/FAD-binding protein [Cupriavidus taiwanensis]SOZ24146.1 putative activating enzyme (E1 family) of ubiquitin-like proteins; NAD/FAD-binding protein [Cupriavidus taiwanensis]SOZ44419.1 putative activating enzyme (E1 family) of ubiquitin-like proteins; NAD/FAD-binding protein [Cupriavidus taiwanensis]
MNDAAHELAGLPEPLTHESPADDDYHRRFGGVARLYGDAGLARLEAANVCVVGIGGVGSWAAEALARNAVGRITLIDLDHIALSNTNRQIHALGDAYGRAKVEAMAERIVAINPRCHVTQVDDFVTADNVPDLLGAGYDYVIDAIDTVRVKTAMLGWSRGQGVPVITCGGAGGQLDPTRVRIDDLARTIQDPLLSKVRASLRKQWGFSRDPKKKFGIAAVYSDEPLQYPEPEQQACEIDEAPPLEVPPGQPAARGPQGLACAGFGSSVAVTAVFGLVAASAVIGAIARG